MQHLGGFCTLSKKTGRLGGNHPAERGVVTDDDRLGGIISTAAKILEATRILAVAGNC
jgi:hypothetical protein